jgi:hypothetical protein
MTRPFTDEHDQAFQEAADRLLDELLTDPYKFAVEKSPAVQRKYGEKDEDKG